MAIENKTENKQIRELVKRIQKAEEKPILPKENVLEFPFFIEFDIGEYKGYLSSFSAGINSLKYNGVSWDYADENLPERLPELKGDLKRYEQIVFANPIWPVKKLYQLLSQGLKKDIELAEIINEDRTLAFWGHVGITSKKSIFGEYPYKHHGGNLFYIKNNSVKLTSGMKNFLGNILFQEEGESILSKNISCQEKRESILMNKFCESPVLEYGKKWNLWRSELFKEKRKYHPHTLTLNLSEDDSFQERGVKVESINIEHIFDLRDFIIGTPSIDYKFRKSARKKYGDRMVIVKMDPTETNMYGSKYDLFALGGREDLTKKLNNVYPEILVPEATCYRGLPKWYWG